MMDLVDYDEDVGTKILNITMSLQVMLGLPITRTSFCFEG